MQLKLVYLLILKCYGVFQMEGGGMKELLVDIRPDRIDDIIACIALYRPGPMGSKLHIRYARRKNNIEPIAYDHPLEKTILEGTYGVLTYQEQVGLMLQKLAGLDIGDAVLAIKAISKKRSREELNKYRDDFRDGAGKNGIPADLSDYIFDQIEEFAGYGFNKAHSAAYGLVAYQTAFLKANYPIEFYTAYLSSEMHDADKISQIINEMAGKKIELLPPDVNSSLGPFTIEGNGIRFALCAIKNVGSTSVETLVKARETGGPFKSVFDFAVRVDTHSVNRQVFENLILSGAMDSIEGSRSEKLASIDRAMEFGRGKQEDVRRGQAGLFVDSELAAMVEPELARDEVEIPKKQLLKREKDLIGIYLSENPLKDINEKLGKIAKTRIGNIDDTYEGKKTTVGGMLTSLSRRISKRLQNYAIIQLEDLTGRIEGLVFPKTYEECREHLIEDSIIIIDGRIQVEERDVVGPEGEMVTQRQLRLIVGSVKPFDSAAKIDTGERREASEEPLPGTIEMKEERKAPREEISVRPRRGEVLVEVDLDEAGNDGLDDIFGFFSEVSGPMRVRLLLQRGSAKASVDLGKDIMVDIDPKRKGALETMNGVREVLIG